MSLPETLLPNSSPGRSGNFLYSLLHVVWPVVCPVCGRLGRFVCDECMRMQIWALPAFCLECGTTMPCGLHEGAAVCLAGSSYGDASRAIVHAMKYKNGRSVAKRMGHLLAETFARPSVDYLVPVPLHKGSDREYNQAELIARGAGEVWGIPVRPMLVWRLEVVQQAAKSGDAERILPVDAIAVKRDVETGAAVFLIDDVYTTGNTMRAARDALSGAGVRVAGAMVWSKSESRNRRLYGGKANDA